MADVTLLIIPAQGMICDEDAQLVAGDGAPGWRKLHGRPVLAFDDTDEEAALSPELPMPTQYAAGTLKAKLYFFSATQNSGGVRWDVAVEAVTPDSDTLDLEAAASWDSVNAATHTMGGTAGDLRSETITLTNKDSVAAGDGVRFGVRRDTDHAGDTMTGDIYLAGIEILEDQ